ncbi:NAD-dependent succinate-semialdehyde dehydrogenase [Nocardia huaxiensis]|uniref:NAD-dependent succinate-semialdehyde dehydrogenase n=1 Tax=Nocardia huaxiensis TaxID=2755382 RepID=A0A7D6VFF3_9NOCA|nr:NAD-dependent succinate-semialdehyde dehydrogenase [Nocardia huaxiensis]QLY33202.1 NAD-dependent succinate-semialdehyde dehydrogenase [Nocardia huaxiensis]
MTVMATEPLADIPVGHYIDGRWTDDEATMPVENPATGAVIAQVADAHAGTGVAALDAAVAAQSDWAATDPRRRSDLLMAVFRLLHERAERFATLITLEMGKPYAEALSEVAYGAEFLRWFAEEGVRGGGKYFRAPTGDRRILVTRQAVGPVFAITPWNFPLAMVTRKIAPALAAGCTVVLKPAPQTPLTALEFMRVLHDAGVPAGVVNCLTTSNAAEVSTPVITDERLRKLTFTGSTTVGRLLLAQASRRVLRTSMELGGNAPFVVLESADLDKAVSGAVAAKMRNTGQACVSANRFLVHESLAAAFAQRLAAQLAGLPVGDGMRPGTQVGPLIDRAAVDRVAGLVADAVDRGARLLPGAEIPQSTGYFVAPAVLTEVDPAARVLREEIFGPIAPITAFTTTDEALAAANATEAGLIGYVYGENLGETMLFAEGMQTGMVGVNTGVVSDAAAPFGGVKASGIGREGGSEGLEEYLETKYIGVAF